MGKSMIGQVFGQHRALAVAAGIMGLVGLVPGMPHFAFLSLAVILGALAWLFYKRSMQPASVETAADDTATASLGLGTAGLLEHDPRAVNPNAELTWDELRPIDPLGLEVGYRLIPLVDKNQGGELMARLKGVRRKLTQDLGFLVPRYTSATTSNSRPRHIACWCTACRSLLQRSIPIASWRWIRVAPWVPLKVSRQGSGLRTGCHLDPARCTHQCRSHGLYRG